MGAHNDTTYFTDPVGLLFFHLILHDGTGGESIFVDGFKCAEILRREHKWAFDALHRIEISAHSIGSAGVRIQPNHKFKILNSHNGHLDQIRYNYHDRSILHLDAADTEEFYAASREWDKIVRSKENEFWIKLTPGLAVMFNNWRVLHGRAEFTGYRTLIGSYHNMDDFRSKITTELGLKERFDV